MAAFAEQPAIVVGDRADHGLTLLQPWRGTGVVGAAPEDG